MITMKKSLNFMVCDANQKDFLLSLSVLYKIVACPVRMFLIFRLQVQFNYRVKHFLPWKWQIFQRAILWHRVRTHSTHLQRDDDIP